MKPHLVQIRGSERWAYQQQTTINSKIGNSLNPNIAIIPKTTHSLERTYYNGDRLNPLYIRRHLSRLRDAWLAFGDNTD
jgi:hypothetical protein